jgi:hypothetical protein
MNRAVASGPAIAGVVALLAASAPHVVRAQTTCTLTAYDVVHPDTTTETLNSSCVLYNAPSGTVGAIAVWGEADGTNQVGVGGYATSGTAVKGYSTGGGGVVGYGLTGVAGQSPTETGVSGEAGDGGKTGPSGAEVGVWGFSDSSGVGVVGLSGAISGPSAPYGVYGASANSDGVHGAVDNSATAVAGNNTGTGYGVLGVSSGSDGVHGQAGNGGSGVAGINTGSGVGVYGNSYEGGYGVEGQATNLAGVYGTATSGFGVQGTATGGDGVYGTGAVAGVYGITTGTTQAAMGVYGQWGGGSSWAGFFDGNVYVTGTVTQNSDARLKQNVRPLVGAIDELLRLKGVAYEWTDPDEHGGQTGTQRGFIAQDVEKVFPGWVGEDARGFKTLTVQQIEALEVESIRTLKDRADKADARADKAEAENAKLKAQLADHDARLDAIERGRPRAPVSPIGFNPATGLGVFGFVVGGLAFVSNRKKKEEKAP